MIRTIGAQRCYVEHKGPSFRKGLILASGHAYGGEGSST